MNSFNIEKAEGGYIVRFYEYSNVPSVGPSRDHTHVFTDLEAALGFIRLKLSEKGA